MFDTLEAEELHQLPGFGVHPGQVAAVRPGIEALRIARLYRQSQVLPHRERREQVGNLERACQSLLHHLLGRQSLDPQILQHDTAGLRAEHAGDGVEERGLAGTIRPDQRVQFAVRQLQIHAAYRSETTELLSDPPAGQDWAGYRRMFAQESRNFLARLRRDASGHCAHGFLFPSQRRNQKPAYADQSGGREQDEAHEQKPEPELPRRGVSRQHFAEHHVEEGAQRRTQEMTDATKDGHRQNLAGEVHVHRVGGDEHFQVSHQAAAQTGDGDRDDERSKLVSQHRVADKACAVLVLPDCLQHRAQRGMHDSPHHPGDQEHDSRDQVIEQHLVV